MPVLNHHQQLYRIVFEGKFPSKIVVVKNIPFKFILTDKISETNIQSQLSFLEKVVMCKGYSGDKFIKDLPITLFFEILNSYFDFQIGLGKKLFDTMPDFTRSFESRGLWEVYKHSNPGQVLNIEGKLNEFQKRWIMINSSLDRKENIDLIADVFDVLKPWLDKELFAKIEDNEELRRDNIFYDERNLEAMDKEFIAKAERMEKANKKVDTKDDSDLDIITIDDEK